MSSSPASNADTSKRRCDRNAPPRPVARMEPLRNPGPPHHPPPIAPLDRRFYPVGQITSVYRNRCQALSAKIFLFFGIENQAICFAIPSHSEGRCARSPMRDGDAVDADGALDPSAGSGRRNRMVLTPQMLVSSSQLKAARATVAKVHGSPGRPRISRKPLRRESRMPPLNLYARVRFSRALLHTRPRVQRAPGLPCALFLSRAAIDPKLGRIAPRQCGRVSAV